MTKDTILSLSAGYVAQTGWGTFHPEVNGGVHEKHYVNATMIVASGADLTAVVSVIALTALTTPSEICKECAALAVVALSETAKCTPEPCPN